jgi:hypothetical protein
MFFTFWTFYSIFSLNPINARWKIGAQKNLCTVWQKWEMLNPQPFLTTPSQLHSQWYGAHTHGPHTIVSGVVMELWRGCTPIISRQKYLWISKKCLDWVKWHIHATPLDWWMKSRAQFPAANECQYMHMHQTFIFTKIIA